jgi:hypothetical protein
MFLEIKEEIEYRKGAELGDLMPNLKIASPFDSTVYSSVWSIGIVTYSLFYPLSPDEPAEDACS